MNRQISVVWGSGLILIRISLKLVEIDRSWDGLYLNGPFSDMVGYGILNIITMVWYGWDPNEGIDLREWSVCGGGRL